MISQIITTAISDFSFCFIDIASLMFVFVKMAASAALCSCVPFLQPRDGVSLDDLDVDLEQLIGGLYDSMTECLYQQSISSFSVDAKPQAVFEVDILAQGRAALQEANDDLGSVCGCVE